MASTPTELIKEKLDVVEFIRGYVALQPAGKNFKGRCPFHKEKTPSFMVSPERQSWHCFGCSLGGDVFAFLMRYENLEFGDALRALAERTGIVLRRVSPADYQATGLLYDINNAAKEFFRNELDHSEEAQAYLRERKLTNETAREFELGWAPLGVDSLSLHLLRLGYRPDDIIRAGVMFRTDRGAQRDRFRGRVMFPIHNHVGKVVGFTGRVLPKYDDGQMGKYVNSPETAIFNKSKLLYGFWRSKNAIRDAGKALLVEGQMDFLMSWQAGAPYAVATSGTAFTPDHLRTLRRFADQLVLSFDTDEAGMAAGERAIDLAAQHDFSVSVVSFGTHKDPADAAVADPEYFLKAIEGAYPAPQFYFGRYLPKGEFDQKNRDHLRGLRVVLGKLKRLRSPVERNAWIHELQKRTQVSEQALLEEMEQTREESRVREEGASERHESVQRISRYERLCQELLASALGDLSILDSSMQYLVPPYDKVAALLKKGARKSDDPRLDAIVNLIVLCADGISSVDPTFLKQEVVKEYVKSRRQALAKAVKSAEAQGNDATIQARLEELNDLARVELGIA